MSVQLFCCPKPIDSSAIKIAATIKGLLQFLTMWCRRFITTVAIIVAAVAIVNAENRNPSKLIDWLSKEGQDRRDFENSAIASPLGFPLEGIKTKTQGFTSDKPGEPDLRLCKITVDFDPRSLILISSKDFPKRQQIKQYFYRFDSDGKLRNAVSVVGLLKDGEIMRESGQESLLSLQDPEIEERAQAELDFWIKHVERLTSKKKGAPAPGPAHKAP